jgi:hypothetical protein
MIYAGIGSRQTPADILDVMRKSAMILAIEGYVCNTGAALGADQAFAEGALVGGGKTNLQLPWNTYENEWINAIRQHHGSNVITTVLSMNDKEAYESVEKYHPAANRLSSGVVKLHARNYNIVAPAKFVICWTPEGKPNGGTGQGIKIATALNIPIYNLGNAAMLTAFIQHFKN